MLVIKYGRCARSLDSIPTHYSNLYSETKFCREELVRNSVKCVYIVYNRPYSCLLCSERFSLCCVYLRAPYTEL